MTEEEARDWIAHRHGSAGVDRLARFVTLLVAESRRQNLIARSTIDHVWSRHIVDSAQLAAFASPQGVWLDVGSGGGLPGVVLALLLNRPFVLCEPRRLRAAFLVQAVAALGVADRVEVAAQRVEMLTVVATTITARAVASIDAVFAAAGRCADTTTTWILPRGQSAVHDVEQSTMLRRAVFHVEPSVTGTGSAIVIATGVCQ